MVALLKYKLPSIEQKQKDIVDRLFIVLSDYSASQNVVELRVNLFKCLTLMIQDYHRSILTKKRLQILLNYAEADVIDSTRQTTAFALINVILGKNIKDEKIVQMMEYLGEISVTSPMEHIQRKAREMIIKFIKSYKLTDDDFEKWINFYIQQLDYGIESGRLSALEMIHSITEIVPKETCDKFALLIFLKLSERIVNDDSKKCINFVLLCVRKLVQATSTKAHGDMLSITTDWINTKKDGTQIIGCKVINELTRTIPQVVSSKLEEIMVIICSKIDGFDSKSFSENVVLAVFETMTTISQLIPKHFVKYFVQNENAQSVLLKIKEFISCYQSKGAQLAAAELLGQLLDVISPKNRELVDESSDLKKIFTQVGWLEFVYSMCFAIKNLNVDEAVVEQSIKNLVALCNYLETDEDFEGFLMRTSVICPREFSKMTTQSIRV